MSRKKKPNSFIQDGLSIDETRVSVLMLTYFIAFITCIIFFVVTKDGEGLRTLFFSTIGAVTGLNITNLLAPKKPSEPDDNREE